MTSTYKILFQGLLSSFLYLFTLPTLSAQSLIDKEVQRLYEAKTPLQMCVQLEYLFWGGFLDKIAPHQKADSLKLLIFQKIEQRLTNQRKKQYNYLIYSKLAFESIRLKNNSKAFQYFKEAEKTLYEKDKMGLYYYHENKFACFSILKKTDSALYHARQLYKMADGVPNDSIKALASLHLASAFYRNKMQAEARIYFKKAIAYESKEKASANKTVSHTNTVGLSFREEKNYDSAHYYFEKALNLAKEARNFEWVGIISGNIGSLHIIEKNYKKAIEYLSVDLVNTTRNKKQNEKMNGNAVGASIGISEAYIGLKDFQKAKLFLDSAKNNLNPSDTRIVKNFYELNAKYHEAIGDFREAYKSMQYAQALKDSLTNTDMMKKANEINAQLDFDRQRKEIDDLYLKTEKQAKENEQQNNLLLSVLGILALSITFSYLLFRSDQSLKRFNKQLIAQKEEISNQTEEMRIMNEQLIELDQFKQNLTNMVVHDLKNPINALLHISNDQIPPQQKMLIKGYSQQMLNLVLNVLDIQKFEEAKMLLDKQEIAFSEILDTAIQQVEFLSTQKNVTISIHTLPALHCVLDAELSVRILVNLLNNALKYAPQNTQIEVEANLKHNFLYCSIKDEGKGIPADKSEVIFQKYAQLEPKSREKYQSTGLGLTFCKMAVEEQGGKIGVESSVGKGAKFWFTLPNAYQKEVGASPKTQSTSTQTENKTALDAESKKILVDILPKFEELDVYYTSDLENLLEKIDFQQTENLEKWSEKLKNAIHNFNQELYKELIAQIRN